MDEVLKIAREGASLGCKEALITLGDAPEDRWPATQEWLDAKGYDSTLAYVRAVAIRILEETGLLPHLNPGVRGWEDLQRLKPVAPSMGMMLEATATRLWGGANDVGGTLMEETISRMAGAQNGSLKTVKELRSLASSIGRPARQRTTTYGEVGSERLHAADSFDEEFRRHLPLVATSP